MSVIVQTIADGEAIDGSPGRGGVELGEAPVRVEAVYVAAEVLDAALIRALFADASGSDLVLLRNQPAAIGPPASIAWLPVGGVPLPGGSTLSIVIASHTGPATIWIVLE